MTSTSDEKPLPFLAQFLVDLFGNGGHVPGDTLDNAGRSECLFGRIGRGVVLFCKSTTHYIAFKVIHYQLYLCIVRAFLES